MARLQLSPPWEIYYKEINLLFGSDPEVKIFFDSEAIEIKLYVNNAGKAEALAQIIPEEVDFGSVTLKIAVIPANDAPKTFRKAKDTYEAAFENNPIVAEIVHTTGLFDFTYVVFVKKVVQYFNDDIGDVNGQCSTLYQDIAKRIFKEQKGVFYCTFK